MRTRFNEQLVELNNEMINMSTMIETAIARAVEVLSNKDQNLAKEVIEGDVQIDRAEKKIQDICFNLLIQQQPVARDLRNITAAMNMVTDMERIGDQAADICEMTVYMADSKYEANLSHINKMAVEIVMMLNWSVEAYVEKDAEKAEKVIAHDDVVDKLFDEAKKDIINLIASDPKDGEEAVDLLMVAKYFERIGDHATNIAEWVIYSLKTSAE
ncbi:MAG: phosphate signaling complex protein PhoU [Erysipelotrichaceae bacterium]|nr:phosphate signaling complex protein PhoU [Erysipelotrichaceae bacterium]